MVLSVRQFGSRSNSKTDDLIKPVSGSVLDETSSVGSTTSSLTTSSKSPQEAFHALFQQAAETLSQVRAKEAELQGKQTKDETARASHWERARARWQGGNSAGAILSLRKVHRMEHEISLVVQAIQSLQFRKGALSRFLSKCKTTASMGAASQSLLAPLKLQYQKQLQNSVASVDAILGKPMEDCKTDEELLKELEETLELQKEG